MLGLSVLEGGDNRGDPGGLRDRQSRENDHAHAATLRRRRERAAAALDEKHHSSTKIKRTPRRPIAGASQVRGEGPIPRELDQPTAGHPQAARAWERLRATLVVREDDTFPAKSPGAGPGERRRAAVEQRS